MNCNVPPNLTNHQPLIFNPLTCSADVGLIAPGAPRFIVTHIDEYITTHTPEYLTTHG